LNKAEEGLRNPEVQKTHTICNEEQITVLAMSRKLNVSSRTYSRLVAESCQIWLPESRKTVMIEAKKL
jgi:hypothetical protein